ncbi:hypothetical protein D9M72_317310 [compost metagenome]
MPCTAATVGTCAYLNDWDARWNFSTVASSISQWPAAQASETCCRLAPTAKGASCQITSPSNSRSAFATDCRMPSSTSAPSVWFFEVTERMAMPASAFGRFHRRTPSFSQTVTPRSSAPSPKTRSGNNWRRYTGRAERGCNWPVRAEYDPSGACTPWRPGSSAQAGSGASLMLRPAAMSSATAAAMPCQPAACQVSNGPCDQPKPQRMARSRSRALSATCSSWAAL